MVDGLVVVVGAAVDSVVGAAGSPTVVVAGSAGARSAWAMPGEQPGAAITASTNAARQARRERGWTQGALADGAGVSRPTVMNLERGNPHGEVGVVFRVLATLELTVRLVDAPPTTSDVLDSLLDDLGGGTA